MTMTAPNKTLTLPSGTTYAYIHHRPSKPQKPTLLFLHGFPCTSYEWRHQIPHFTNLGYGVLAPDLLGYGGSSKPLSPSAYLGSIMAADIISILDHENITAPVIGIAHDWGTYLLSQLAVYYPQRFEKFVFLSVPFRSPGIAMDVHAINEATEKELGYPMCAYWLFLTEDGTGKLLGDHWESWFDAVYGLSADQWKSSMAHGDGTKSFISSDSRLELPSWITPEDKAHHHAVFKGDYSACLTWYKRGINNLGIAEEKALLEKGSIKGKLDKPTLLVPGLRDAIYPAVKAKAVMSASVEDGKLKIVDVDAGHWIMLEKATEVNRILEEFCDLNL